MYCLAFLFSFLLPMSTFGVPMSTFAAPMSTFVDKMSGLFEMLAEKSFGENIANRVEP